MRSILSLGLGIAFGIALAISGRAQADTVFTASCYGGVSQAPPCGSPADVALNESATLTFPNSVPLDGSTFTDPALLSVSMSGVTQTFNLPSQNWFVGTIVGDVTPSALVPITILDSTPDLQSFIVSGSIASGIYSQFVLSDPSTFFILQAKGGFFANDMALFEPSTPSPSLYLTVNTGGPNSLPAQPGQPGQPISINATLALADTPPQQSNTVEISLPAGSNPTTLQQAAADLGNYQAFEWLQIITTVPDPSPYLTCDQPCTGTSSDSFTTLATPYFDPPQNGYDYLGSYNPYPFTQPLTDDETLESTSTTLSFTDTPADPCILGPDGNPSVGFQQVVAALPAGMPSSVCGIELDGPVSDATSLDGDLASSDSQLEFLTELVGVTSSFNQNSPSCTATSCVGLVPLAAYSWSDDFNGTTLDGLTGTGSANVLDLATLDDLSLPINPDSGTGGVTLLSLQAGAPTSTVPEPSSLLLLTTGIIVLCGARFSLRKAIHRFDNNAHRLFTHSTVV